MLRPTKEVSCAVHCCLRLAVFETSYFTCAFLLPCESPKLSLSASCSRFVKFDPLMCRSGSLCLHLSHPGIFCHFLSLSSSLSLDSPCCISVWLAIAYLFMPQPVCMTHSMPQSCSISVPDIAYFSLSVSLSTPPCNTSFTTP